MSAESERKTDVIPQWKREEVADLVDTLDSYESVGIVNIAGIPSRQLQAMRREIYGQAELRVSRNTLMKRALHEVDREELTGLVEGQVGLIGTDKNPFSLFKTLEQSKTPAPINAGEIAPNDIVIPKGDTGMDPGPFVGELQQVGANARIDAGSIKVMADSTVAEEGDEVSAQLANVLSEMGIEPKEVGLDLRGVFADGVLFEPEELALDIDEYRADVEAAAAGARNLSVNAVYPTARTTDLLLGKASNDARAVGISAAIESPDLADDLVGRADARMRALAAAIDDEEALPEALRAAPVTETDGEDAAEGDADDGSAEATDDEQADDQTDEQATDAADDDEDDDGDAFGAMFE